ncbi:hypothetical protein VTO58DRAFT_106598 [Aureobasidium pullulans]
MPRLHPRVLHQAHKSDPLLPLVLRATRDLTSAKNELRWLRDFVAEPQRNTGNILDNWAARRKLRQLCVERAKGKPLQYIMGTDNDPTADRKGGWDILISNPPYISPSAFNRTTTRSVKRYEPKLALVPKDADASQYPGIDPGDIFYPRLLEIAKQVDARVVLFEVADLEQAGRVAAMAQQQNIWTVIEVWRDNPSQADDYGGSEQTSVATGIKVLGRGNGRSVFAYRGGAKA